jgi:hypothetical protein
MWGVKPIDRRLGPQVMAKRIGSKVGLCVALAAPVVALGSGAAHSSSAQGAASGTAASSTSRLTTGDEQSISDMQIDFSLASSVSSSHLVSFGGQVCGDIRRGASVVREVPAVQQDWPRLTTGDIRQPAPQPGHRGAPVPGGRA